jgi:hypothetical protein
MYPGIVYNMMNEFENEKKKQVTKMKQKVSFRSVWRYQRGNQNLYIEEQTTQWPKEKVQKDKQQSTKHTYKTKDRVTRTPLKTVGVLRCSIKGKQFLLH